MYIQPGRAMVARPASLSFSEGLTMTTGRRPTGAKLVARLEGASAAKTRLELILDTLAGRRPVADAAGQLGLTERRFHVLRLHALQAALADLEPRPAGRPAAGSAAGDTGSTALRAE